MIQIAVPAVDAVDPTIGRMLTAALYYDVSGNGSASYVNNINEVSDQLRASIVNAKVAAMWLSGLDFHRDIVIQISERQNTLLGRSWELMLSLGLCSLLTGIPLNPWLTASAKIGIRGAAIPVSSIREKLEAAKASGFSTFIVSREQEWEPTLGIEVYPVRDIKQAWTLAAGRLRSIPR
ncbi:MAG: S16 family serine protease [Nitrososphaerales archaeon]